LCKTLAPFVRTRPQKARARFQYAKRRVLLTSARILLTSARSHSTSKIALTAPEGGFSPLDPARHGNTRVVCRAQRIPPSHRSNAPSMCASPTVGFAALYPPSLLLAVWC
jgi:hypothetical protein